jgi:hypothetical protein
MMFKRLNSTDETPTREFSTNFEPEKTEYAEYRMTAERQSDDVPQVDSTELNESVSGGIFSDEDARTLRSDWENVQTAFVDNPKHAVRHADELVDRTIRQITDNLTRERESLEREWNSGREVSTEELRIALQRYRSFFNRLLSM